MAVTLSFVAAGWVAAPLWVPIVLGCVMAISAHRPYRALSKKLGDRSSLAALLITFAVGLVLAVIGTFVLVALAGELMKIVGRLDMKEGGSLEGIIGTSTTHAIERGGFDTSKVYAWAQSQLREAASVAAGAAAVVLRTTSEAVLGLVVALMTMYYMLREGAGLARRIEAIAPLEPRHTRALLTEAREVGRTAFIGTIFTAIIQGGIAGVGYAALGVPQPVTWAVVTALASFLPMIGTLTVWVPISAWLFVDGHPAKALIMVIWGTVMVTSLADYFIRPRIVGGRGHGHPLLTLIALLGGIEVFGLAGLVIAPVVMSVVRRRVPPLRARNQERRCARHDNRPRDRENRGGTCSAGALSRKLPQFNAAGNVSLFCRRPTMERRVLGLPMWTRTRKHPIAFRLPSSRRTRWSASRASSACRTRPRSGRGPNAATAEGQEGRASRSISRRRDRDRRRSHVAPRRAPR